LLRQKAEQEPGKPPSQPPSRKTKEDVTRRIAKAEVDQALEGRILLGSVARRREGGRDREGTTEGCVSEELVLRELGHALDNYAADGTGLRDFANSAVGGRVVRVECCLAAKPLLVGRISFSPFQCEYAGYS